METEARRPVIVQLIRRNPRLAAVLVLLVIAILIAVALLGRRPSDYIKVSGTIEATEVTLSAKVAARVDQVLVDEGDFVRIGQRLALLRQTDFQEQLSQARAGLASAQAQLREARAGATREEIQRAQANVQNAQAAVAGARQSLALAQQNLREVNQLRAALDAARTSYQTAQASYEQAVQALTLLQQGTRPEQIAQAQAAVARAQATSTRATEDLNRAQILYRRGAIPASQLDAARAAADAARADLRQAEERLAELRAGPRTAEIRQAEARVQQASAAVAGARDALQTATRQYRERIQERQQVAAANTQYETSVAQLRAAQAQLDQLLVGTRPEVIQRLQAQVAQAQAAVDQANTQLRNTVINSPIDATVITRAVEPGELATIGTPLLTLADLREVWLRVYVEQTVYGRIRLGQRAVVTTDSYPNRSFIGRVATISSQAEFTPKQIQTPEERAKLVFGVKITIPNPGGRLKPGMPADATLRLYPVAR